ncbi:Pyridoxal-phosphate dependent enzyme [Aspergillus sclerotialis]|uniref:tryptophan synthase n=1 Tax=Aspergillus sclerotialis TaxID=2070753 RepID=A0A3A3AAG2_9EURO|nr:Pyridoxal-phosphate dependent enzyme [Aspergillus sclerotialis]
MGSIVKVNTFKSVYEYNGSDFQDEIIKLLTGPHQIIKLNDPYQVSKHLRHQYEKNGEEPTPVSYFHHVPIIKLDLSARRFGEFGGRYAPELQMEALSTLENHFKNTICDPNFWHDFLKCGLFEPSPLQLAEGLTKHAGGANIWLKREDLNQYGSHKIRNIVGQILLALRMGKTEIVMDCGYAGHGLLCAALCEKLDIKCTIFMGKLDFESQKLEVWTMKQFGAKVTPSDTGLGCQTIRAALDDAQRYAVSRFEDAYYIPSGPIGPHPLPLVHRIFQSFMGEEVKDQCIELMSKCPDAIVAPVGMGSGAVGMFSPFVNNPSVQLVGVQPAGVAPLTTGSVGVLYGACTYLLQDEYGQVLNCSSYAADLNCPTVGPELSHWKHLSRVEYVEARNDDAVDNMVLFHDLEKFLPSFSTGYAVDKTIQLAKELGPGKNVVLLVSGDFKLSDKLDV